MFTFYLFLFFFSTWIIWLIPDHWFLLSNLLFWRFFIFIFIWLRLGWMKWHDISIWACNYLHWLRLQNISWAFQAHWVVHCTTFWFVGAKSLIHNEIKYKVILCWVYFDIHHSFGLFLGENCPMKRSNCVMTMNSQVINPLRLQNQMRGHQAASCTTQVWNG